MSNNMPLNPTAGIGNVQNPQQPQRPPASEEKIQQLLAQVRLAMQQQGAGGGGNSPCTGGGGGGGGSPAVQPSLDTPPPGISKEEWAAMAPQDKMRILGELKNDAQGNKTSPCTQQIGGCACSKCAQAAAA